MTDQFQNAFAARLNDAGAAFVARMAPLAKTDEQKAALARIETAIAARIEELTPMAREKFMAGNPAAWGEMDDMVIKGEINRVAQAAYVA